MTKQDYTLRRVLYYMMVVVRSLKILGNKECDYAAREAAKCGALISLRALSAFLTDEHKFDKKGGRVFPDDVIITDFGLPHRTGLLRANRTRIDKLFAHAVNVKQDVYKDPEVSAVARPVLQECAGFVRDCRDKRLAKLTGNAPKYLRIIGEFMPSLSLPNVDEW
jgi:hypothetical protein